MKFDPLHDPFWLFSGITITLVVGVLAGVPIARSLSGIQPVPILKGSFWTQARSPMGSVLIVFQLAIAVGLSVVAVSAFRQLRFMQEYDIGFDKEEVIVAQVSWTLRENVVALMDELRKIPGVKDVTGSLRRLGDPIDQNEVIFKTADQQVFHMQATTMFVDFNYIPFFRMELLAGRNISPMYGNDVTGDSYIINESMAKMLLGFTDNADADMSILLGQSFRYNFQDSFGTIVGIVRDFNFNSLHHRVEPLCLTYEYDYYFKELSVRVDNRRLSETLPSIEAKWKEMLPTQEIEYHFLNEQMEQLYRADRQVGQMMTVLTSLAIFISCFGLIGLVVFNTERRVKEIGIRKVLGATRAGIVFLVSKHFMILAGIAFIISMPVARWSLNQWLAGFAYRINIEWWNLFSAGFIAVLIAMFTVILQAIRAASENPVKNLKVE